MHKSSGISERLVWARTDRDAEGELGRREIMSFALLL